MYEGDVVVATYYVAQSREALFYPLYLDRVWYRVAQMLQFLVGCGGRDEKAFLVTCG
jgi:hypothetical protein